ncbi:uncharacterized protein JCM6883_006776 [Sporobolomyces salmoneus]|uniref:uncharacterized protein n=1 Tax=Sporobolomyces salmoneus TaxID=183962 RepID=UPI003180E192
MPNLVSLDLGFYGQRPNLDTLFMSLSMDRLPHLRWLYINYVNLKKGERFDFSEGDDYRDPLGVTQLSDMPDWKLPWNEDISEHVLEAIKMEEKARRFNLAVESNLSQLVQVFHLQIVECYNRAVGELYFNGRTDPLEFALALAAKHGLVIDVIDIDWRKESLSRKELDWFHVTLGPVAGFAGGDRFNVYGIMRREPPESSEEEEDDSDDSD